MCYYLLEILFKFKQNSSNNVLVIQSCCKLIYVIIRTIDLVKACLLNKLMTLQLYNMIDLS